MSKNTFKKHVDLLLSEEKDKEHYFHLKILMIIHWNVEEKIFVIAYKLLIQKKH